MSAVDVLAVNAEAYALLLGFGERGAAGRVSEANAAVAELIRQRDQFRGVTEMIATLNPDCAEIGAGKLRQIFDAAQDALALSHPMTREQQAEQAGSRA